MNKPFSILCGAVAILLTTTIASAMIMVGKGNRPVADQNWPAGSLEVANLKMRLGWWEGPPYGGGEWQFVYSGDVAAFQQALDAFAQIKWPQRKLIVHEGPYAASMLDNAQADWTFNVWDPRSWNHLYNNPTSTFSADDPSGRFRRPIDPPRIDVYVAGADGRGIDFKQVKVPAGVDVIDERATSAGFDRADGCIIRAELYDMMNSKPIEGAEVRIEKWKPQGGTDIVTSGKTNAAGHVELKNVTNGSYQVTARSEGKVSRMLGHVSLQPNSLKSFVSQLAPPAAVKGSVKDNAAKPLAAVKVRADSVIGPDGFGYLLPEDVTVITDADGNFAMTTLPPGHLRLVATDATHHPLEVLKLYPAPSEDVLLQMTATGSLKGKVTKPDGSPAAGGQVSVNPPGERIGKWGGSMTVKADGTFQFDNVPPGPYLVSTNPGLAILGKDKAAKPVEVKAGETAEVALTSAKR
jgi:hypothetical protein